MRPLALLWFGPLALLAGCQSAGGGAQLDMSDHQANVALTEAWERAMLARQWTELGALYTQDAVLMPPNEPAIQGRPALIAYFEQFPKVTAMDLRPLEVGGSGDVAYLRGSFTMSLEIPGVGAVNDAGKYLEIRRRGSDGVWRIASDIFNSDLPGAH
jgi:ketosteroid isomerase-like protein